MSCTPDQVWSFKIQPISYALVPSIQSLEFPESRAVMSSFRFTDVPSYRYIIYITNSRLVSAVSQCQGLLDRVGWGERTERVRARELWFLGISGGQLVTDAVEELHITLLRALLQSSNEGP